MAAMMSEVAVVSRGGHRIVVVLECQSLKRHILEIRRDQNLGELRNDHRIGVRILTRIGQIRQCPRTSPSDPGTTARAA